ncbi:hypothetical protein J7E87_22500 [Streptomyces sp. ISL-1]|uniref:hypothetical protein n=1 Tax=Streptomyces sp. ISL-1 TaxID=2817657 RepID=UPI001BE81949|nr:hypothetical protein [Streptomyces sp. ISL-1]MBT2392123.1 hypothetical protein [Streptomyces sp. ISL-1]
MPRPWPDLEFAGPAGGSGVEAARQLMGLDQQVIEAVTRRLHPESARPVTQGRETFTTRPTGYSPAPSTAAGGTPVR